MNNSFDIRKEMHISEETSPEHKPGCEYTGDICVALRYAYQCALAML